jgi:serine/threonine-protein kinase
MALPQRLGRYTLERRLAAGGMAEVFLARQSGPEGFEKVCVVKRMLPHLNDDQTFVGMFLDEARLAARLTHPNIAQIFDFGHDEEDDAYYLAMEYVPGANLHRVIDDHSRRFAPIPLGPAVKMVALACAGLDFAHSATDDSGAPLHIIHRDVSPHNIMLSKTGDIKLIDFGIAKANVGNQATKAGTLKGKYAYMAPEQIRGQPLDQRTDIYAMGLVLYELLAGRPAIVGDSEATLMGAAARRDFAPIHTLRPEVPQKVRDVLERATALNLSDRYGSAVQMSDELEDFLVGSGTRVRASELASLLTASTNVTNVSGGTPGTPLGASPSFATPAKTDVAVDPLPAVTLPDTTGNAPAHAPTQKAEWPDALAATQDEVTAPQGAPLKTAPSRAPAMVAIGLVALAASATALVVYKAHAPESSDSVLVPPPPARAVPVTAAVKPSPAPAPAPAAEKPAPADAPAPAPVAAAGSTSTAPAEPAAHPKPTGTRKTKEPHGTEQPATTGTAPAATRAEKPTAAAAPQGKGTVMFRVLPYAEVFRDGQSLGVTPLKPLELEAGKYAFKFVCADTKKSDAREVTVTGGSHTVVKVDLR